MRTVNYKRASLGSVLVILILTIVAGLFLPLRSRPVEGMPLVKLEMQSLLNAVQLYQAEYDKYPSGSSSEISQALLGNHKKKHVFLSTFRARSTNKAGQFVDPWGTPYEIAFESTNCVMIRCAGKNRSFGDKDDVTMSTSLR
jgi:hypothetical protein